MKIALDIFCGSGSFGTVAREFGYEVLSVDIRRRAGVCEPTFKADLMDFRFDAFEGLGARVGWFGQPCTIWSNASGGFHLDDEFNPKTELAEKHLELFHHTLETISRSGLKYWVIENPRGKMEKYPHFKNWLDLNDGHIYHVTLSSYGFPTTKPTMIATNHPNLKLRPMDAYGRGAKNKAPEGTFDNMTTVQRQATPKALIREILKQMQE